MNSLSPDVHLYGINYRLRMDDRYAPGAEGLEAVRQLTEAFCAYVGKLVKDEPIEPRSCSSAVPLRGKAAPRPRAFGLSTIVAFVGILATAGSRPSKVAGPTSKTPVGRQRYLR